MAWAPEPQVGDRAETIANRYRVLATVGRGGMGEVLKVGDLFREGQVLALKRFRIDATDAVDLFRREFLTLTKLRHPNVAEVYDFGTIPGTEDAYFTSEFVNGIDLFDATAGLAWEETTDLVVQLCRGLAYVHSRGLVHRDVKPSNVLVANEGGIRRVKLIDFGLATALPLGQGWARELETLPPGGEVAIRGTVHYLAPEVAAGRPIDRRADLYSLGVTLFQVATRELPFAGFSSRDVIRCHMTEPPPAPHSIRPDIPPGFERIVLRLLEKEPSRRYASANQVITELAALSGRPIPVETKETKESYILSGRFVGRDAELEALGRRFRAVFGKSGLEPRGPAAGAGPPALIVVTGDVGVGKTRLLREFKHQAQLSRVDVIEAACHPAGRAYAPVAEIARKLLQLVQPSEEGLLGASGPLIRRFLGEAAPAERPMQAPAAAPGAGGGRAPAAPLPTGRSGRLADPTRDRLRLFDAVVTFFLAATWMRPAVVIVHALERADAETVAFIAHLARAVGLAARGGTAVARPALLVVATLRDGSGGGGTEDGWRRVEAEFGPLEEEGLAERVHLEPLPEAEVAHLAATMLGIGEPGRPELLELARFLHRETGGNPFFIEELMKLLLESGVIQAEAGGFRIGGAPLAAALAGPSGARLEGRGPPAIRELFRERLARLEPELLRVLEALAVALRPATARLLDEACPDVPGPALAERLEALAARGMLVREPAAEAEFAARAAGAAEGGAPAAGEEAYRFAHEIFRQAVYAAIEPEARRRLHAAFAAALEESAAPDLLVALAEHFAAAGNPAKAFRYAVRAGDEARGLFANERAIALYERALELAQATTGAAPGQAVIEVLESLGRVRERVGDHAGAAAGYRRILERPEAAGVLGPEGLARIERRIGETCEACGEHDAALESYGVGLRLLGEGGRINSTEGAKLLGATASTYVKLGLYDMAISFCQSGLGWLAGREDMPEAAALINTIGVALSCTGRYEDAAAEFERALAARERVGEPEAVAQTLNNLGAVYVETGQLGRAIAFFEQALERFERMGDARGIAETSANLGNAYTSLGQDERAAKHFCRGLEIDERLGDPEGVLAALNRLGSLETNLGEYGEAVARLERARRLLRRIGETRGAVVTGIFGARLLARLGDREGGRYQVEEALRLAAKLGLKREQAEGTFLLGRIERAEGRLDEAERALNRALTDYEKLGNEFESAGVTVAILEVMVQRGDLDLAEMLAAKLEAAARDVRAGRLVGRLELAIGHLEAAAGARAKAAGLGGDVRLGEAVRRFERARDLARDGRRPERLWRAEHALARTFRIAGAPEQALASAVRAMEVVRDLYARVPAAYKAIYLADPARQALRDDFQALRR